MHEFEALLVLLLAVAAIAVLARKIQVPYPMLLVVGGLLLAFVPGLPRMELRPELVFLLFLPPLLYPAALFTSWRDFQANLHSILLLAIGLVLVSTAATAWLAHRFAGLPWAPAFVLGAIVSPPDAVAVLAIVKRLGVPHRIVTILEGESLVNDATSLVAFRFAVAAVVTGTFSPSAAGFKFVAVAIGGILAGLAVGWTAVNIQRRLDDPPVQITFSLLTPFAAYLLAESLEVSGVLAVVIAGLYIGWRSPQIINARMRLQAYPVWEMIEFILNGILFIMIGAQLPGVLARLHDDSFWPLARGAALICLGVILVRIIWVFPVTYLPRLLFKSIRKKDPCPCWQHVCIVAWAGLRGVDSLAAALAIPLVMENGSPFPSRDMILFLTYCVIFSTLLGQGLTLPALIRWLEVKADRVSEIEEREARLRANHAALARLEELAASSSASEEVIARLSSEYTERINELDAFDPEGDDTRPGLFSREYERLSLEALRVERQVLLQLRNQQVISDEVLRRVQHDIDLAESRLRHHKA